MPTLYLFADANLFLHYKPLDQISWSKLGEFDNIELVVCRTVQREIDMLKDGREGRRSSRARKAASALLEIAQHGPKEYRETSPRVVLSLYGASQPKQDLDGQLDYSQSDDRIIGHLAQFRADNPLADVRLLTRDSGPILTANALDIPYVIAHAEWRLEPETDDKDRKIQELTQQLIEMRSQEPEFHFSCDQQSDAKPGHVEVTYGALLPLEKAERVELMEWLQNLYPPTVVRRNRISAKAISEYEERDYPAWLSRCQELLGMVNRIVQLEHCPEVTLRIQNNGSRPATNARVEIRAYGNFGLTAPISELKEFGVIPVMERPQPPDQPQPQATWPTILNSLTASSMLALPDLDFMPGFRDQEAFEYVTDPKLEPEPSIVLICGLWRHSLEPKEFKVRMIPTTFDSPTTGEITCTVHADNLTKPTVFKLVVTLAPDSRATLMPAFQWFTTPHPNET